MSTHRSETNGIAERAVRRIKEGTSAVPLQSGLGEKSWADSMESYCYLRNVQDLLSDGQTLHQGRFGVPFKGPIIPLGAMVEYHPVSATASVRQESLTRHIPWICVSRGGESGKEMSWSQTLRNWKRWTHLKSTRKDSTQRKC